MKKTLISIYLFLIYFTCLAQSSNTRIIKFYNDSLSPSTLTLQLANNKKQIIDPSFTFSISPNEQIIALMKNSGYGILKSTACIINNMGDTINRVLVEPFDRIAIGNNCNLAVFGFRWTPGDAWYSNLYLYDSVGNLKVKIDSLFGPNPNAYFTNDNHFIFISTTSAEQLDSSSYMACFFDKNLNQINQYKFKGFKSTIREDNSMLTLTHKLDTEYKILIVEKYKIYKHKADEQIKKELIESYKFDYDGNLIK